jgi:prepilin-type N-terminal cleavage/methylation domain-containing protein/prepilin-type processing-associated H-X9-DG protein
MSRSFYSPSRRIVMSLRGSVPRPTGFTLVELLVVIGIIAVLVSILLPALGTVREQGRATVCMSNLRQIGTAMQGYAMDNDGFFPGAAVCWPQARIREEDWIWYQDKPLNPGRPVVDLKRSRIAKYIGGFNADVLRCPSDDISTHVPPATFGVGLLVAYKYSYTMNTNFACLLPRWAMAQGPKLPQIKNPTEKVLVAEEDAGSINDGTWDPGNGDVNSGGGGPGRDLLAIRHDRKRAAGADPVTQVPATHPNGERRGNVAFADGHAEFATRLYVCDKKRIFANEADR